MATDKVKGRGRPKLPPESVRNVRIVAMVTQKQLVALQHRSALTGLSISEVIRTSVMALIANEQRQDS